MKPDATARRGTEAETLADWRYRIDIVRFGPLIAWLIHRR